MTHNPSIFAQPNFRIRSGDTVGLNVDSGWVGNLNANATIDAETIFRIRFEVEETSGNANQTAFKLQYRKNGGTWTDVAAPGYPLATSTPACQFVPGSQYTDGDATTNLLSGSGRTFVTGSGETANNTITINQGNYHTEFEVCLIIRRYYDGRSQNNDGDTFEFRFVESGGTAFAGTYSIPVITLNIPAGLIGGCYSETYQRVGPWKDSNGNLYAVVEFSETDPRFGVHKSTDGGDTWTPLDVSNGPSNGDLESCDIVFENDRLYILHMSDPVYLSIFRVSTAGASPDTWETIDEVVTSTNNAVEQVCAIVRFSSGKIAAVYTNTVTNDRIFYKIRSAGGSWGSEQNFEVETGIEWSGIAGVLGASGDTAYFIYAGQNGACYYRTITGSTEALSSRVLVTNSAGATNNRCPVIPPVYYDASGTEKIHFFYLKNPVPNKIFSTVLSGGSLQTETQVTDQNVEADQAASRKPAASVWNDGTTVYIVYSDDTTDDIWLDKNLTEAGWGTDVEIADNKTVDLISATVFTHSPGNGGAKVIGFTYANGSGGNTGDVWYGEYALPVSVTIQAAAGQAYATGANATITAESGGAVTVNAVAAQSHVAGANVTITAVQNVSVGATAAAAHVAETDAIVSSGALAAGSAASAHAAGVEAKVTAIANATSQANPAAARAAGATAEISAVMNATPQATASATHAAGTDSTVSTISNVNQQATAAKGHAAGANSTVTAESPNVTINARALWALGAGATAAVSGDANTAALTGSAHVAGADVTVTSGTDVSAASAHVYASGVTVAIQASGSPNISATAAAAHAAGARATVTAAQNISIWATAAHAHAAGANANVSVAATVQTGAAKNHAAGANATVSVISNISIAATAAQGHAASAAAAVNAGGSVSIATTCTSAFGAGATAAVSACTNISIAAGAGTSNVAGVNVVVSGGVSISVLSGMAYVSALPAAVVFQVGIIDLTLAERGFEFMLPERTFEFALEEHNGT